MPLPTRWRPLLALGAATATLLAGCASAANPRSTAAPTPIHIGAIYPLTGPQGGVGGGLSEERGVQLAADWVNQHGGVNGHQVSLDVMDVPTAESVPSAISTLQSRHIDLLVGTHGSTMSAVAAQIAQQRRLLLWETGAVGDTTMTTGGDSDWSSSDTGPAPVAGMGTTFFRMAPQGSSLGRAGIDFVLREVAPKLPGHPALRVAVAYVNDVYGQAVAQGVIDQVRADHVELAGVYAYPEYGANFAQLAAQIKRSGANVLYSSSYLADGEALRLATIAAHVPLVANVGTSSSYCLPAFGEQLQGSAVGLFASDKAAAYSINPAGLLPEGRTTLAWAEAQWKQRYGGEMDAYATSGFANAYALFAHVLPASTSFTPRAVAAAATAVKLPAGSLADGSGLNFPSTGSEKGENQAAASVIWEWVSPGKEAVVWPPAYATQGFSVLPIDA
jgi:ABC-type branched-subunit amino acid transport system substrate-binding protein